jgi:hypothetical protein
MIDANRYSWAGRLCGLFVVGSFIFLARGEAALQAEVMCGPADAKTIVKSDRGRAYSIGSDREKKVYACLDGGKPRQLSAPQPKAGSGPFIARSVLRVVLKAPWVGYSWELEGFDSGETGVSSRNLKTGGLGRTGRALNESTRVAWTTITDLELKRNGSVAWMADGRGSGGGEGAVVEREVGASDQFGARSLENSLAISPRSLRLSGSTVSWLTAGLLHTVPLR